MPKTRIDPKKMIHHPSEAMAEAVVEAMKRMMANGETVSVSRVQQYCNLSRAALHRLPGVIAAIHSVMEAQQRENLQKSGLQVSNVNPPLSKITEDLAAEMAEKAKMDADREARLAAVRAEKEARWAAEREQQAAAAQALRDAAHNAKAAQTSATPEHPVTITYKPVEAPAPKPQPKENPSMDTTPKTFWQHVADQEGLCKMCKVISISDGKDALQEDTYNGSIRGLLCKSCLDTVKHLSDNLDNLLNYIRPGHVTVHKAELDALRSDAKPKHSTFEQAPLVTPVKSKAATRTNPPVDTALAYNIEERNAARDMIRELLTTDGPKSKSEIANALGIDPKMAFNLLQTMIAQQTVTTTGNRRSVKYVIA